MTQTGPGPRWEGGEPASIVVTVRLTRAQVALLDKINVRRAAALRKLVQTELTKSEKRANIAVQADA